MTGAGAPRRTTRWRVVVSALAGTGLLVGALALADALGIARGPEGGLAAVSIAAHPAPPLAGTTLTGGRADLAQLHGRVVVVTVWASWCPPCRDELPVLADAHRRYPAAGVAFLGILTRDDPTAGRGLLAQTHADALTSVRDPSGSLAVSWGATGVPETFVVDARGTVRAHLRGPVTGAWLDTQLRSLLGRPS